MNVDTDIDKDVEEKYLIPDIGLLQYQVIPIYSVKSSNVDIVSNPISE